MLVVSVLNQKGGVGKTTTVVNLAAALATTRKKRVILLDLDQQANASSHLGVRPEDGGAGLVKALIAPKKADPAALVVETPYGIDIIPSGPAMVSAERDLSREIGGEKLLSVLVGKLRELKRWDICLIDCSPHLGLLAISALTTADFALVPCECSFFALEGLARVQETIEHVKDRLNERLSLLGVLACRFRKNQSNSAEIMQMLREALGDQLFSTVIAENVRLQEAPSHGKPINAYDKRSQGATDYAAFAAEFLKRIAAKGKEAVA